MKLTNFLAYLLATGFGLGKIPWAPGTWGSGVGVFLYWASAGWSLEAKIVFLLVISALGAFASGRVSRSLGQKDPSCVIIDEVAGVYLALLGHPADPLHLASAFLLFRVLDIWKPPPVSLGERLPGGAGIMADDLLAGGLVNLILVAIHLAGNLS